MKLSRIALGASFSVFAALISTQAGAEEYQGVLQTHSTLSRSDVRAQAVAAAHSENPYSEAASASVVATLPSPRDRTAVRSVAQAVAHAPGQNLYVEAFTNSQVPAQYGIRGVLPTRQAGGADSITLR